MQAHVRPPATPARTPWTKVRIDCTQKRHRFNKFFEHAAHILLECLSFPPFRLIVSHSYSRLTCLPLGDCYGQLKEENHIIKIFFSLVIILSMTATTNHSWSFGRGVLMGEELKILRMKLIENVKKLSTNEVQISNFLASFCQTWIKKTKRSPWLLLRRLR